MDTKPKRYHDEPGPLLLIEPFEAATNKVVTDSLDGCETNQG